MNSPIKVLALNDDNHETCFVTLGSYFPNSKTFMKECLLKPHTIAYEVRGIYACDEWSEDEEHLLDEYFDLLAGNYYPEKLFMISPETWELRNRAFELLWNIAKEDDWYV